MMQSGRDEELRLIQKKLILVCLFDAPGAILVGLGLHAILAANDDVFIDVLNDQNIAYGAILVGGVIMVWSVISMFSLLRRKAELVIEMNG